MIPKEQLQTMTFTATGTIEQKTGGGYIMHLDAMPEETPEPPDPEPPDPGPEPPEPSGQQVLLEDFSSMRKNGEGEDIWAAYEGEDPGQTYTLENGMFKVAGGGTGIYCHFFPYPYVWPQGFAQHWAKSGTWNTDCNRLRFKMKCNKNIARRSDGGDVLQIGTYVKPHSDTTANNQGQHYYHLLDPNVYADRWVLIEINRQPQHIVGGDPNRLPPLDPEWESGRVHYFDGLTRFYVDTMGDDWSNAVCYFEDFSFDTVSGSPDDFVSSISATHSGSKYEVAWATRKNENLTYKVRYSTDSLKVDGFGSGTDGGTVASTGNAYTGVIWMSPNMPESSTGLYVGIQPPGQSAFTEIYIPAMNM